MEDVLRLARESDAEQMLAIYAPIVRETAISFELEPPSLDVFTGRIQNTLRQWPWLVYESDGRVTGYAYAGAFRTREAYQWSTEVTVYVDASMHRGGVGSALYTSLLACLKIQGYCQAIAMITLPNPGSVGLHQSMGFQKTGVFNAVGRKLGGWHNVGIWQLDLRSLDLQPPSIKSVLDLEGTSAWDDAIGKGVADQRA